MAIKSAVTVRGTSGSSVTATVTTYPLVGACLIAVVNTVGSPSFDLSGGNVTTWVPLIAQDFGVSASIWVGTVTTAGAAPVTLTGVAGSTSEMVLIHASNLVAEPIDQAGVQYDVSSTHTGFPVLAPTGNGEILIAACVPTAVITHENMPPAWTDFAAASTTFGVGLYVDPSDTIANTSEFGWSITPGTSAIVVAVTLVPSSSWSAAPGATGAGAPPPPPAITPPTITIPTATTDALRLYGYLPQFVQDGDAAGGYVLLSWIEGAVNPVVPGTVPAACAGLQQIDDIVRDNQYGTGWSSVMDVGRCPNYALLWLAQFVGVNIPGSLVGTSPADDAAMRQAILAKNAFMRGTPAAIQAAAAAVLGPSGSVNIIERYPDPYSLTIQYFDANGGLTYAQLAAADPTYALVAAAYPFYDDFPISAYGAIQAAILAAIPAGLVATVVAG